MQFLSTYKNVLIIDYIDNDFNNISIIKLPAYSPELDPIEQVWSWLRQHHLANRYFNGDESIVDAVYDAWNDFVSGGKRVIEMFTRDWMILSN